MTKNKVTDELDTLVIYNEAQQFYVNVSENATATIKQMEDAIKLNKAVKEMAIYQIDKLKD